MSAFSYFFSFSVSICNRIYDAKLYPVSHVAICSSRPPKPPMLNMVSANAHATTPAVAPDAFLVEVDSLLLFTNNGKLADIPFL